MNAITRTLAIALTAGALAALAQPSTQTQSLLPGGEKVSAKPTDEAIKKKSGGNDRISGVQRSSPQAKPGTYADVHAGQGLG